MLNISKEVFQKFAEENIQYCHWKSNEHLEDGMKGITDLDVLVNIHQKNKCESLLHELKFLKTKAPVGNRYKYVNDWLGMDQETGEMIHLHLHYKIVTGKKYRKEFIIPWDQLILKERVYNHSLGVYMTDPNIEIILLYTRIILKTNYEDENKQLIAVPSEYYKEIRYLKLNTDEERIKYYLKKMFGKTGIDFKQYLFKDNFTQKEFQTAKKILIDKFAKQRIETKETTLIKHVLLKQYICILNYLEKRKFPVITKKITNKKGLIIAFIGIDGSGKSTLTNIIQSWISWKIEAKRFYLGCGDGMKKPFIYKLYVNTVLPQFIRNFAGLLFYIKTSYTIKNQLRIIKKYIDKGGIAIIDRYPQNQYKGMNDGPKIEMLIKKQYIPNFLLRKVIQIEEKNITDAIKIQSDIIFKLNITPEEAVKRKRENNLLAMKQKKHIMDNILFENSIMYNINAEQEMRDELLKIKKIIWNELVQRQLY